MYKYRFIDWMGRVCLPMPVNVRKRCFCDLYSTFIQSLQIQYARGQHADPTVVDISMGCKQCLDMQISFLATVQSNRDCYCSWYIMIFSTLQ